MKKNFIISLLLIIIISCNKKSEISKDFNCNTSTYSNLEKLDGIRKDFSLQFPKNWNTKYYYDNIVSSIYSADTTVSLTQTTLIDVSHILNPIEINDEFIRKIKSDNSIHNLQEINSKKTTFLNKEAYYNLSKGKKRKFDYQVLNIFTKTSTGFLHIKTEVYGDSLVNERLCKAINLFDKIEIK